MSGRGRGQTLRAVNSADGPAAPPALIWGRTLSAPAGLAIDPTGEQRGLGALQVPGNASDALPTCSVGAV